MYLRIQDMNDYLIDNERDLRGRTKDGRRVRVENVLDGDMCHTATIFQEDGRLTFDLDEGFPTVDV